MLRIDLKPGESVRIGDIGTVTLEHKSGQAARLSFDVDKNVSIKRVGGATLASIAGALGIFGKPKAA